MGTAKTKVEAAPSGIKPIAGSWFEFQHHATVEGVDWNPACARFTPAQWDAKVKEIAGAGMEYLVLMATALCYRAFFDTRIFPKWQLASADPLETVLSAADKYKIKFFIGGGFYGDWESEKTISDPVAEKKRLHLWKSSPNAMATTPASTGGIGLTRLSSISTSLKKSYATLISARISLAGLRPTPGS
jgi:Domain of unknown function (DUF4434)